ncbi:flagellar protein FlaG [Idiomarina aquatica]|uniref:Flagellar protein FlaG n=1 Tax=Idiomarina aquatica TaxID=1327752 RepID=A0A4R6PQR4_9GAMM|nr:flagellar protein FlaG [Idiomarina aquatica]TDP40344.1 flagellar protein FlaG [Idiomarina aquatica]
MGIELNALSNSFSGTAVESGKRNVIEGSKDTVALKQKLESSEKVNGLNKSEDDKSRIKSTDELRELVDEVNRNESIRQRNLEFSVNEDIGATIVKVIDSESGELIRQIPSEEIVRLAEKLSDQRDETGSEEKSSVGYLFNSTI